MKIKRALKTLLGSALMVAVSQSYAAVVSYENSVSDVLIEIDETLSLQRFDTSLGELESVQLTISGATYQTFDLDNRRSPTPARLTVEVNSAFAITYPTISSPELLFELVNGTANTPEADSSGFVTIAGGEVLLTKSKAVGDSTSILIDEADFGLFTGKGNFDLGCSTKSNFRSTGTGTGNLTQVIRTFGDCSAQVTYNYKSAVPVPTPAGAMLLVVGVVGLVASRRYAKNGTSR